MKEDNTTLNHKKDANLLNYAIPLLCEIKE